MALKGAQDSLAHAKVVQMEVSFFPFQKDIPLLGDIAAFMNQQGFRIFNIFGVYGRPLDGMPVQGECLFIKNDSSLISDMRWAEGLEWS